MALGAEVAEAHLIIAHPSRNAVLLRDGALPVVPTARLLDAGEELGVPIVVCRTQYRDSEHCVVACEATAEPALRQGLRWTDVDGARRVPRYADVVGGWF